MSYLENLINALRIEICEIKKKQSGQRFVLINGRKIHEIANDIIYSFETSKNVIATEDSPAKIQVNGISYDCTINNFSKNTVQLTMQKNIGSIIKNALLIVENWYLLDILRKKLKEDSISNIYSKSVELFSFTKKNIKLNLDQDITIPLQHNESQIRAINETFTRNINIIWGPPGTGKTQTISSIITKAINNDLKVLLLSLSNNAVDQALVKTIKLDTKELVEKGKLIRVGTPKKDMLNIYREFPSSVFLKEIAEQRIPDIFIDKEKLEKKRIVIQLKLENISKTIQCINQTNIRTNEIDELKNDIKRTNNKRNIERHVKKIEKKELELKEISKSFKELIDFNKSTLLELYNLASKVGKELEVIENSIEKAKSIIDREILEIVNSASLIATTLTKAYIDKVISNKKFDIVIIDEVSMAPLPMVYWAASRSKSNISLVGDFLQLPPISQSNDEFVERWYKRNIFDFLDICDVDTALKRTKLLDTQYRMHPEISAIINNFMYGNNLKNSLSVNKHCHNDMISNKRAVTFIDTNRSKPFCSSVIPQGRFNIFNVNLCYRLLKKICTGNEQKSFGVVTPYKHQAKLINNLINDDMELKKINITINTIHSFQGGEEDVIILDTVDTNGPRKWSMLNETNYKESNLLLNVAISRARNKLYILGDRQYLLDNSDRNMMIHKIIDSLKIESITNSYQVDTIYNKLKPSSYDVKLQQIEYLEAIQKANNQIVFLSPSHTDTELLILDTKFEKKCTHFEIIKMLSNKNIAKSIITNLYYQNQKEKSIHLVNSYKNKGFDVKLRDRKNLETLTIIDNESIWIRAFDFVDGKGYLTLREISSSQVTSAVYEYLNLREILSKDSLNGELCPVCGSDLIIKKENHSTKNSYFRCVSDKCKSTWSKGTTIQSIIDPLSRLQLYVYNTLANKSMVGIDNLTTFKKGQYLASKLSTQCEKYEWLKKIITNLCNYRSTIISILVILPNINDIKFLKKKLTLDFSSNTKIKFETYSTKKNTPSYKFDAVFLLDIDIITNNGVSINKIYPPLSRASGFLAVSYSSLNNQFLKDFVDRFFVKNTTFDESKKISNKKKDIKIESSIAIDNNGATKTFDNKIVDDGTIWELDQVKYDPGFWLWLGKYFERIKKNTPKKNHMKIHNIITILDKVHSFCYGSSKLTKREFEIAKKSAKFAKNNGFKYYITPLNKDSHN